MSQRPWIKSLTHITKCHHDDVCGTLCFKVSGTDYTLFVREYDEGAGIVLSNNPSFYFCRKQDVPHNKIVVEAIASLSSLRKHLKRQQKQIKKLLSEYNND